MPLRPRSPQSKGRDSRRDTCYPAAPAHSDNRRGTLRTGQQWQSEAISDHQPGSREGTGHQWQSEAIGCTQMRSEAIGNGGLYPEPFECTNGEGNHHACKRTCVEAEQLEPPASATRDDIGFLRPESGLPSPQLEVQRADLMRGAISDQVHSLRYNGRI